MRGRPRRQRHILCILFTSCLFSVILFVGFECRWRLTPDILFESFQHEKVSSIEQSENIPISCKQVALKLASRSPLPRSEMNELRRKVAISNPACYKRYEQDFANDFMSRSRQLHFNLHIPKAGGTSLCKLVRNNNITTPGDNCWEEPFCPVWCCACNWRRPVHKSVCDLLEERTLATLTNSPAAHNNNNNDNTLLEFAMNENYFDYPFCNERTYSIVLRDPVDRAMSHVNHFFEWVSNFGGPVVHKENATKLEEWYEMMQLHLGQNRNGILNMVQSNYMVWSLVAGNHFTFGKEIPDSVQVPYLEPTYAHLQEAKSALAKFDFLIDIFDSSLEACTETTFQLIGLTHQTRIQKELSPGLKVDPHKSNYKDFYRRQAYEQMNQLDIRLYEYAKELVKVDCAFFLYLEETTP
jgi:hypothetical protein